MMDIPDAPWIRECEATGYYSGGLWNSTWDEYDDDIVYVPSHFYEDEDDADD